MRNDGSTIIDVNAVRDPDILLHGLTGLDEARTFYYDETNNIRRFVVTPNGFNVRHPEIFVLGGIVHQGGPCDLDLAGLRSALRLQPTVREVKFQHVAHGDFLAALRSKRLETLLDWVSLRDLNLHYIALDPLYWAIVDIIDSIVVEAAPELLPIAAQIKNDLHSLLRDDLEFTCGLFHRFGYPEIDPGQRIAFIRALLARLDQLDGQLGNLNAYMLKGALQIGARGSGLPFLEGEKRSVLIDEFSSFFLHRICLFKQSRHIFDDEDVVKLAINRHCLVDGGREIDIFRFTSSHDEPGIQISDAVIGLIGKFLTWLNGSSREAIVSALDGLDAAQDANRRRLSGLVNRSTSTCSAFLQHILSLEDQQRFALFLEA